MRRLPAAPASPRLSGVLGEAMAAFLAMLDRHGLADLVSGRGGEGLRGLFLVQAEVRP
jgi:hypothetical protein